MAPLLAGIVIILVRREPRLPVLHTSTIKSETILARMAPLLAGIVIILVRREPRLPVLQPSTIRSETILARMAPLLAGIVVILVRREPRLPVLHPSTVRSEAILGRMAPLLARIDVRASLPALESKEEIANHRRNPTPASKSCQALCARGKPGKGGSNALS